MQEDVQETEVRETNTQNDGTTVQNRTEAHREQPSSTLVVRRLVWFVVGLIDVIIALRFVLLLLGANRSAGFTDFIYSISAPLVSPFVGIFGEPVYGKSVFEISSVLAIIIYALIGWGITALLTIGRPRGEA